MFKFRRVMLCGFMTDGLAVDGTPDMSDPKVEMCIAQQRNILDENQIVVKIRFVFYCI